MRTNRMVVVVLVAAVLSAPSAVTPRSALGAGALGVARVAEPDGAKGARKLGDYVGCITAIVAAKDVPSAWAAVLVCASALQKWSHE